MSANFRNLMRSIIGFSDGIVSLTTDGFDCTCLSVVFAMYPDKQAKRSARSRRLGMRDCPHVAKSRIAVGRPSVIGILPARSRAGRAFRKLAAPIAVPMSYACFVQFECKSAAAVSYKIPEVWD